MLLGRFEHSVDAKGRVAIPARFRDALGPRVIVNRGLDGQLLLFPPAVYEAQQRVSESTPSDPTRAREFTTWRYASVDPADVDSQGRVLIPSKHREYAGINGSAVILGFGDYVQVWSPERLEALEERVNADPAGYAAAAGVRL